MFHKLNVLVVLVCFLCSVCKGSVNRAKCKRKNDFFPIFEVQPTLDAQYQRYDLASETQKKIAKKVVSLHQKTKKQ